MLDAIREMSENLAGMGVALAGKALSGVFSVVRDLALKVEAHTGISVPFAHSGMPVVVETQESTPTWQKESTERGANSADRASSSVDMASSSAESSVESVSAEVAGPAPGTADKDATRRSTGQQAASRRSSGKKAAGRPSTAEKRGSKSSAKTPRRKSSAKSSKGKKSPGRSSQILRLLDILAKDENAWMSAVELAAATAEQGSRILPGNVRKAIRLRAEGLIESRTRPGSKRGATEYRITDAGLAYLRQHT